MPNKNIRALSFRKELDFNLFEEISRLSHEGASQESFRSLAEAFLIDDSIVFGVSSFYDFTRSENREHKVHVCNGSSCMVAGTQGALKTALLEHYEDKEIGQVSCLGHCHQNHAFMKQERTYSATDLSRLPELLKGKDLHPSELKNDFQISSLCLPILTQPLKQDLVDFYHFEPHEIEQAISQLKTSELRGRGGAGFPFWFKIDAVKSEKSDKKYVVCNADEGDPGAFSDMYLLENQPHKVLAGMYFSSLVCGADTCVLYIRGEYPQAIETTKNAIRELTEKGLAEGVKFKIIRGQGSYICGEETALLSSIEGLRPEVRVRPPYPAQEGLFGKPTLLSNVETFANLPWILENGGGKYSDLGTQKSTGTKLISLDSSFNRPGVYEVEMGTPMPQIIDECGNGFSKDLKAIQIGGPLGGIVPIDELQNLSLDFESFSNAGFLLGHASFVGIPKDYPMIQYLSHLFKFTAEESCGKCYPCRIGSQRGYEMLEKSQKNPDYKIELSLFEDLLETLEIGSLCALGGGLPLPIKNAMQYFSDELNAYFEG